MRSFWLLFLLVIYCSFGQKEELFIIPGKGIGPLEMGKTTRKDVENFIGKGKPTKELVSFCSRGQGVFKKFIYSEVGLELLYSNLTNPKWDDTLTTIRINESSKLKTIDGIGIGSTRKEVEKIFGKALSTKFNILVLGEVYHAVRYNEIEFVFDSHLQPTLDSMDYKVKEMEMWKIL